VPCLTGACAVTGPTGVGKSALALRLCKRLGGEIISVDSVQVEDHMHKGGRWNLEITIPVIFMIAAMTMPIMLHSRRCIAGWTWGLTSRAPPSRPRCPTTLSTWPTPMTR
jgi:hypothetical protein